MEMGVSLRTPDEDEVILVSEAARALSSLDRCTELAEDLQQKGASRLAAAMLASLRRGEQDPSTAILDSLRRMEGFRRVTASASALLRPMVEPEGERGRVQMLKPVPEPMRGSMPARAPEQRTDLPAGTADRPRTEPVNPAMRDLPLFRHEEDRSLRLYEVAGLRVSAIDMGPGRFIVLPGSDFDLAPRRTLPADVLADRKAAEVAILPRQRNTATFVLPYAFQCEKSALAAVLPGHDAGLQPRRIDLRGMTAARRDRTGPDEGYLRVRSNILGEALDALAPQGKRAGPSRHESRKVRVFFSKSEKGMFQIRREHLTWATGAARKEGLCLFLFGVEGYVVVPARQILDLVAGDWLSREDRGGDAYRFLYGECGTDGTATFHLGVGKAERIGPVDIRRA